jgi:heme iron utilization protein
MNASDLQDFQNLVRTHRQATLAVSTNDEPFTAMVSYAMSEAQHGGGLLVHLSNLSLHKRLLLANPKCSLLIAEPDDGRAEVMSLARVTLNGNAIKLSKETQAYAEAKAAFLAKLPTSEVMFGLADFDLFRITPSSGRFIAGFGRAFGLSSDDLLTL